MQSCCRVKVVTSSFDKPYKKRLFHQDKTTKPEYSLLGLFVVSQLSILGCCLRSLFVVLRLRENIEVLLKTLATTTSPRIGVTQSLYCRSSHSSQHCLQLTLFTHPYDIHTMLIRSQITLSHLYLKSFYTVFLVITLGTQGKGFYSDSVTLGFVDDCFCC